MNRSSREIWAKEATDHLAPGEQARRLVRHGLADILKWFGENVGPPPGPFPTCHYCPRAGTTVDHVVPRAVGGPNDPDNLVPACPSCNQRKADRLTRCACAFCTKAVSRFGAGAQENAYVVGPRAPRTAFQVAMSEAYARRGE